MTEYIQLVVTVDTKERAESIASLLVEQKLAACVQVSGPVKSVYHWQGKLEEATEWMCFIKSRRELYQELENAIRSNHPYEVPEILAFPVLIGYEPYLQWVNGCLKR
ncbi:MAG: divalent-cation tolerance protein CutA [Syntrophales bacterium]|nr:divalent-cation tolerance protein CutA [Syntrophales bacterium]